MPKILIVGGMYGDLRETKKRL